jgi:hypothetical protein
VALVEGLVSNHLAPFFGSKDLREIEEEDLLGSSGRSATRDSRRRQSETASRSCAALTSAGSGV